jgi:crotonobetainyl-CoA:carnitine CoA-transferase CaiB-like acyl-CoA transferase
LPPPLLGEHTSEILESLGYTAEQVKSMAGGSAT